MQNIIIIVVAIVLVLVGFILIAKRSPEVTDQQSAVRASKSDYLPSSQATYR